MRMPRTIFGPFVAGAALLVCAGMVAVDGASAPAQGTKDAKSLTVREKVLPSGRSLIIPVAGVETRELVDTYGAPRSEGRAHQGIDIMAPLGTAVLAASDGRIARFQDSELGGVGIYQFDASRRTVFYYAHLNARAAGLREGQRVRQGEIIGYVGMSGNAPVPHLHFEIQRVSQTRRWWTARAIDPYPHLRSGQTPG